MLVFQPPYSIFREDYKGAVYFGCAESPDWADTYWSLNVNAGIPASIFREDYKGAVYFGCAETPDWADTCWYYVQGGPACNQANKSEIAGELRMFRKCDSCNCMRKWNYKGAVSHGCSQTPDWPNQEWCHVQGGPQCNVALKSTIAGETRMFRQCKDCNCMRHWNYKGQFYAGCAMTPDWPDTEWCYVQGGPGCNVASKSEIDGEPRMFRQCGACNCMQTWNYKGAVYHGCAETPDWADTEWCYVQDGPGCAQARKFGDCW